MDNPPLSRHDRRLDEGIRMKWLRAITLMAGLACSTAGAADFYEDKPLAHPLIEGLQESSATLAFIKEPGGVKGYYCLCNTSEGSPQLLDDFGQANIESVFLTQLDSEGPIRLVLFKLQAKYRVYAYKYDPSQERYSRLQGLQKALDRITEGQKRLDALTIKKALAQLTPINYGIRYQTSGIDEFDQLDLTQGTLVSYYGQYHDPLHNPTPDDEPYFFKKTYQEKDGRFLTVTFWRAADTTVGEGQHTLYNYQVRRIAWETAPAQFTGSEDGQSASYYFGNVSAQGAYQHGLRSGTWMLSNDEKQSESGEYVKGKREGQWTEDDDAQGKSGEYRNDLREGRWVFSNEAEMGWIATGFQTYAHGQLNGPSELTVGSTTEHGNYLDDKRQGPWVTDSGSGNYTDGLQSGPWTLKAGDGHRQAVNFVAGKKDGELRDTDANGVLIFIEHYKAGVLSGSREGYAPNGKLTFVENYTDGKLDGHAQHFSANGERLLKDFNWRAGVVDGPYRDFFDDGRLASDGVYENGKFIGLWIDQNPKSPLLIETRWCSFDENGPKVDRCGKYRVFENGKLRTESDYLYGREQTNVEYNVQTGKKTKETIIGEDDQVTVNGYGPDGTLSCKQSKKGFTLMTINQQPVKNYDGAKLYGEQLCYYPSGVVRNRYYFDRGYLGCAIDYDESGKEIPQRCAPLTPEMERRMQKFLH